MPWTEGSALRCLIATSSYSGSWLAVPRDKLVVNFRRAVPLAEKLPRERSGA